MSNYKKFISGAKIILALSDKSHITYTDSEGLYVLKFDANQNDARVHVEADGYEGYDLNILDLLKQEQIDEIRLVPLPDQPTPPPSPTDIIVSQSSEPKSLPYTLEINQTYQHPEYEDVYITLSRVEFTEDERMRWYVQLSNQSSKDYKFDLNFQNANIVDEKGNQYKLTEANVKSDEVIAHQAGTDYNYWFDAPLPENDVETLNLSLGDFWNSQQNSSFEVTFNAIQIPMLENEHPYDNDIEKSWSINNATGSNATRIHFSQLELEDGVDKIEIRDNKDTLIQEITQSSPNGLWSDIVPADLTQILLKTDSSGQFWGFMIDQIEPVNYTTLGYSPHPYPNNAADASYILNDTPNPDGTLVHFDRIELEEEVDYIIIKDTNDVPYQWITGSYPDGFTSKVVPGAAVQVQLVSDGSVQAWGYNIDAVQSASPDTPDSKPSWTAELAESDHPYDSNTDQIWTVVNPDVSAKSSKIYFSRIDTDNSDVIEILDENNLLMQNITGSYTDFWSDYIPGRVVKIKFKAEGSSSDWGFRVDAIKSSVPNPGLAQSEHPYNSNADQTWTVVNPDVNAVSSKIHFSRINVDSSDVIEIRDENGRLIQIITGSYIDLWSDYIPGRVVKIRFKAEGSSWDWGFRVDEIKNSVPNPGLVQSDHPYANVTDETWVLTNPDVNAVSSKIHFSRIDVDSSDVIEIRDENGRLIQIITGSYIDLWSDYVPGRVVKIRFKAEGSSWDWGFRVDEIKNSVPNPGLVQSDHPYPSVTDETWVLTNPDVNAVSSKIHFSRIDVDSSDVIEILDENGALIQTLSGSYTDLWSDYVPGRVVKIRFKAEGSSWDWGFRVDTIESK